MRKLDLTGMRFGRLTVLQYVQSRKSNNRNVPFVLTKCDCGNEQEQSAWTLTSGKATSCGCIRKEVTGKRATKHGESKSRLHRIWCNMHSRCSNNNTENYQYYGGRGITVCIEWNDYITFAKWARENGYSDELTIDRINNNAGYSPDNCQWVTWQKQAQNRRQRSS